MRVVSKNLMIKEIKEDIKSESGLILGDGKDIKFSRGTVVSVGEDIDKVFVGDIVRFDRHRTYPIIYNGTEYMIMDYGNIVIVE